MHLSYTELTYEVNKSLFKPEERYSIHLPDYTSPTELINPFSTTKIVKERSVEILENAVRLAGFLFELTGEKVPLVMSVSSVDSSVNDFYENCVALSRNYSGSALELTYQILPPFAWYFGGSVPLTVYCAPSDWDRIAAMQIPITLDLSHLIMSCNYYNANLEIAIKKLLPCTKHVHLALAEGIDGEGVGFSNLSQERVGLLRKMLSLPQVKVIEVWQGHLNQFSGFRDAIKQLLKRNGG